MSSVVTLIIDIMLILLSILTIGFCIIHLIRFDIPEKENKLKLNLINSIIYIIKYSDFQCTQLRLMFGSKYLTIRDCNLQDFTVDELFIIHSRLTRALGNE